MDTSPPNPIDKIQNAKQCNRKISVEKKKMSHPFTSAMESAGKCKISYQALCTRLKILVAALMIPWICLITFSVPNLVAD